MNKSRTVLVAVAGLAAATVIAACSSAGTNEAASASTSPSSVQTSSVAPAAAHNQADVMFAHMMIPHHQQAIEMSDIILAKPGIDPRVSDLATQIKAAQGPEIEQMQGWLTQWGMPGMPGMDHMPGMGDMPGMDHGMPGMDGMLSPAEMRALQDAQGVQASRLFLTGMIAHHEGAITMAQNEIENGQYPEAISLAESIATSQKIEIDTMNQILKSL